MKKLLIILALFIAAPVLAQDSAIVEVDQSVDLPQYQEVSNYYFDKAEDFLKGFAAAIKQPAESVWKILVTQQIVRAAIFSFVLGLGFLFLPISIKAAYKGNKDYDACKPHVYGETWNAGTLVLLIISITISVVCIGVGIGNLDVIFTGFINPEYGALKEIMDILK